MKKILILVFIAFSLIKFSYADDQSQGVPNAASPDMQAAVAKERMLRAQLQASADEEQSRVDAANKKLDEQIEKSNQQMQAQQQAEKTSEQNQTNNNSKQGGDMGAFFIPIILLGILIFLGIGKFNNLVQARESVRNALSQINVLLKRRHDLIPNVMEAAKGYMGYEKDTLEKVTKARQAAVNANEGQDKFQAENNLTSILRGFYAVAENYPNLKADQNVLKLQTELSDTENKISFARQDYNNKVQALNVFIQSFPDSIVAAVGHFEKAPFFQSEKAEETPKSHRLRFK